MFFLSTLLKQFLCKAFVDEVHILWTFMNKMFKLRYKNPIRRNKGYVTAENCEVGNRKIILFVIDSSLKYHGKNKIWIILFTFGSILNITFTGIYVRTHWNVGSWVTGHLQYIWTWNWRTWQDDLLLSLRGFCVNSYSYEYKNKLTSNGAQ